MLEVDVVNVVRDLRKGGWVVQQLPNLEHIEVDPARLSGRPTIRGRRLEAEFAGSLAASAEGREILRRDYDLSDAEIDDARDWFKAVEESQAA